MVCRPHRIMWSLKHLAGESCDVFCSNSSTDTACGTSMVTSWYPTRSLDTPPGHVLIPHQVSWYPTRSLNTPPDLLSSILPSPQLPHPSCMPFYSSLCDGPVCPLLLLVCPPLSTDTSVSKPVSECKARLLGSTQIVNKSTHSLSYFSALIDYHSGCKFS